MPSDELEATFEEGRKEAGTHIEPAAPPMAGWTMIFRIPQNLFLDFVEARDAKRTVCSSTFFAVNEERSTIVA